MSKTIEISVYDLQELRNENKNLNVKVASLEGEIKGLNSVIEKLREENQTLELWLDNKEKVNKSLREENKKLKEKLDKIQDEYDELYIEKCNASNQWKCCEAENKELKDKLLTYMRK